MHLSVEKSAPLPDVRDANCHTRRAIFQLPLSRHAFIILALIETDETRTPIRQSHPPVLYPHAIFEICSISIITLHFRNNAQEKIPCFYKTYMWLQECSLDVQGRAKERSLSYEKVLPGSAWLVLSKTGPFFCTSLYTSRVASILCMNF